MNRLESNPVVEKNVCIHVGLPRAASTLLQNCFFNQCTSINYLGKDRSEYPEWMMRWHYSDDQDFIEYRSTLVHEIESRCREDQLNLISSEMFTMYGGMSHRQADRIHSVIPSAKIILVLRDPINRMKSFYKFNVEHEGFHLPLEECIDWKSLPYVFYKRKPIYLPDFYYDNIIQSYCKQFGEENLCLLRFEDLTEKPKQFFAELAEFIGEDFNYELNKAMLCQKENASSTDLKTHQIRRKNLVHTAAKGLGIPFSSNEIEDIDLSSPVMPDPLRDRIINQLSGRCAGYYV